jgi:hypothetical protein
MPNQGHAAMLQLIAEGMRSPAAGRVTQEQLNRVAGLLDRIAVDLLVPVDEDEVDLVGLRAGETSLRQVLDS